MPVIKAQKIAREAVKTEDTLSVFCYHFPQYTYAQARALPYKRVRLMLKAARKEQARQMIDLMRVIAGSNSKKGIDNVLSYFKDILEG